MYVIAPLIWTVIIYLNDIRRLGFRGMCNFYGTQKLRSGDSACHFQPSSSRIIVVPCDKCPLILDNKYLTRWSLLCQTDSPVCPRRADVISMLLHPCVGSQTWLTLQWRLEQYVRNSLMYVRQCSYSYGRCFYLLLLLYIACPVSYTHLTLPTILRV